MLYHQDILYVLDSMELIELHGSNLDRCRSEYVVDYKGHKIQLTRP